MGFLVIACIAVTFVSAGPALRREAGRPRKAEPGEGHTEIEVHCHFGGMGGGNPAEIRVPRDPQAYARAFVPGRNRKGPRP